MTLHWREMDSNRRYRVARPGFREGLISPLLDSLATQNSANANRRHDDAERLLRYQWFESCFLQQGVCLCVEPWGRRRKAPRFCGGLRVHGDERTDAACAATRTTPRC